MEHLFQTLNDEFKKTLTIIQTIDTSNISLNQIVETYFQISNISSMCKLIENSESIDSQKSNQLDQIKKELIENFDKNIHPKIIEFIENEILTLKKHIESIPPEQTPEEIEESSKLFDKLRELMSTKEFVFQYGTS
jgi:hypothetical protein